MTCMLKKFLNNEKGLSLIEIIASLIILTIILLSFFTFFINSAKTTKTAETIFDATYYAQMEMEKLYNLTKTPRIFKKDAAPNVKQTIIENAINNPPLDYIQKKTNYFTKEGTAFDYILEIKTISDKNLTEFKISVCAKGKIDSCTNSNLKASMLTKYDWSVSP